jgi:hypothetical protein
MKSAFMRKSTITMFTARGIGVEKTAACVCVGVGKLHPGGFLCIERHERAVRRGEDWRGDKDLRIVDGYELGMNFDDGASFFLFLATTTKTKTATSTHPCDAKRLD